jgi:hypothetical protein
MLYDSKAPPFNPPAGYVEPVSLASADGAIAAKGGVVAITKGSAAVLTLAAPVSGDQASGGDDGRTLTIYSETAFAHTVTQTSPGFNNNGAASDVGTFGAAKGNGLCLIARGGAWYVIGNIGVTLA